MDLFKEISIGDLTKEALLQRLVDAGIQFNQYAKTLFAHHAFLQDLRAERVSLVKIKLSDLSLNNPCSYQAILDRARGLGFGLCPLYLGGFLRLEYLDQPEGSYLTIASHAHALEHDENYPTGFYLRNFDKSLWLRGYRVIGDAEWPADNEFVMVREAF